MHIRISLRRCFILHPDIFKHLGIDLQGRCQLAERLFPVYQDLHHLQAGQNAVARTGIFGENDVTGLLSANAVTVFHHVFIHIPVPHRGFCIVNSQFVKGFVQAEIGHDRRHHGVGQQLSTLFHVPAIDVQDMVAGDHVPPFIHAQAAVCIAIVRKAYIQPFFHHQLLQPLNMGGACVPVDVQAVGFRVDHAGGGSQCVKHRLCNAPGAAVGAVQPHLYAPE